MTNHRPFIYLDHNATTPAARDVADVVAEHLRETYANPGSRHQAGRKARRILEAARESLAAILGAQPDEVTFTSGGTESINLALFGLARGTPATLALTAGEHPATMESGRALAATGWRLHFLPVDADGRLQNGPAGAMLPEDTRLVSVILAHNETGIIQDAGPLAAACAERGVPLHLDAVQAVGKVSVNFRELGAAALSLGAHKFGGPRGVGALLVRRGVRLNPRLFGGHQETDRRPGTEPVALIAGMACALELWHAARAERTTHLTQLRDQLEHGLRARCAPVVVNGSQARRLPNTLNIAFSGLDGEALLVALDLEGVGCSLGSTCASGSAEPAPALVAMGCPPEVIRSSVRFSLGVQNTAAEIAEAVERIAAVVARHRDLLSA